MTIRRQPSDFAVEEKIDLAFRAQLEAAASPSTCHAVYELTKTSLTTPEAVQAFAKAANVREGTVDYAGLKDKHAHTVQCISIGARSADEASRLPEVCEGRQWSAKRLGWSRRAMDAAAIEGNRFTIVVRDISRQASDEMDRRAAMLRCVENESALLVVNYFGDQRFGSARHGQGWAAKHLIRGEFEAALKLLLATPSRKDSGKTREFRRMAAAQWGEWGDLAKRLPRCPERAPIEVLARGGASPDYRAAFAALPAFLQLMCVEAFQSHLWNDTARRLVGAVRGDVLRTADVFGELVFPAAGAVGDALRWLELPLFAKGTVLAKPWAEAGAAALAEEGIAMEELKIPGVRRPYFGEIGRNLFIEASGFECEPAMPDELTPKGKRLKRTVRFDLPRGSYATVVLRALGQ